MSTEQDIEVKEKEYNHKRRESHLAYRIKESLKREEREREEKKCFIVAMKIEKYASSRN